MKIRLIAVGTKMPGWVSEGCHEYIKRLPAEFSLEVIEISLGHRGKGADLARAKRQQKDEQMLAAHPMGFRYKAERLSRQDNQYQ